MNTRVLTSPRFYLPAIAAAVLAAAGTVATVLWLRRRAASEDDAPHADLNEDLPLPLADGEWLRMRETIKVDAPPHEVYDYWSDPDNLAQVMSKVDEIETGDDELVDTLTWRQKGPLGLYTAEWDAEVVSADFGRRIAWRSTPGSNVKTAGQVSFTPLDGESATAVTLSTAFQPPAGSLGAFFARTLYPMLRRQVRGDLFRVKYDIETLHEVMNHPDAAEA